MDGLTLRTVLLSLGLMMGSVLVLSLRADPVVGGSDPTCGDADRNGSVSVADGVQTLRAVAGLSTTCTRERCDVDGNGSITVTDGVNVLRSAAGLPVDFACTTQQRFVDNALEDRNQSCDDPADPPDGSVFTQFLAALNTAPCFAGHCDWRLPQSAGPEDEPTGAPAELESILDLQAPGCRQGGPCIDPIFGPVGDHREVGVDPTDSVNYWTMTTTQGLTDRAWSVDFFFGRVGSDNASDDDKGSYHYARAVRDGAGAR